MLHIDVSVMCAVFKLSQMFNHSKFIFKKGRIKGSFDLPSVLFVYDA